jgi:ABC-type polysaccharide/polyol phosphate export permease
VANIHLVKKVYFPREILPLSVVLSNLMHFFLALGVLLGMLLVFRFKLTVWILLLPVVMLEQFAFTLGLGLILATSNVFYRDTEYIVQLMLLAWLFLTPVFYPMEILPRHYSLWGLDLNIWRLSYIINPMASIISSYRMILYDGGPPALDFLLRTLLTSLAVWVVGYLIFARYSKWFAEVG